MQSIKGSAFKVLEVSFQLLLDSIIIRKKRFTLEGRYERKITLSFPSNAKVTLPIQYLSNTVPE